jgi:hypothetical protein
MPPRTIYKDDWLDEVRRFVAQQRAAAHAPPPVPEEPQPADPPETERPPEIDDPAPEPGEPRPVQDPPELPTRARFPHARA